MSETKTLSREDWKRKIRALLDQGEQAGSTPEGNAYTEKAFRLMADQQFSKEELFAAAKEQGVRVGSYTFPIRKPFIQKETLLNGIAQVNGCVVIRMGKVKSTEERVIAYGFERDLERLEMLWNSVLVQGHRFCAQDEKARGVGLRKASEGGIHPSTYRRSWWEGYAIEIFRILDSVRREEESKAEKRTAGTAIAIRDKKERVREAINARHGKLRKGRRTQTKKVVGYDEGRTAARKTDLSGGEDKLGVERRAISE